MSFFSRVVKKTFGRKAMVLREDFCGTAAVCCDWVKSQKDRTAYGIDLDPQPLKWGRKNNLSKLNKKRLDRVQLVEGDVRTAVTPPADIVVAQNFSYFCFKTRDDLRHTPAASLMGYVD